ncbi:DUF4405 domain-containing protein [Bacillus sp. DNRA2]|uniref:DUF4405 domain-containing protein n=1 Tax=Bacillus sp. DNRA2 TaxID=2723053 RepID=UPI00145D76A5|nr:DUF4405 domain-containing protein [Bacillus sp. DNRA2]NMD68950.1 DUF4405 domain-containing protein [Bacillus sp. DNRA2]
MKKKILYVQYGLDLIMGVTFALFYNDRVLGGLAFHEIAGLAICGAILAHVLFNVKWVKNVTLKLFNRKLSWKTRISYLLNLLLLVAMIAIIVTGIIISRVVFPNLSIGNERWIQMLHISVSYITLVLVAVHTGLHWQWVIQLSKKIFKVKALPNWFDYGVKMAVVALFLFGAFEMYATGFGSHLASSANIFTGTQQVQFEGQKGRGFERGQFGENGQPPEGFNGEKPSRPDSGFSDNDDMPTPPDGDFQGNDDEQSGFHGDEMRREKGRFGESPSALGVIATYFGIMAVFVILTHYLGKIKLKRKESPLM